MRNRIMESALKVFSEKGYHMSSMEDIRKEANVAKGTLYYHFTGKSDLFTQIVTSGIDYLTSELINITETPGMSAANIIELMIRKNMEYIIEYHELSRVVINETTIGLDEITLKEIKESKRRYMVFLAELFEMGYREGVVEKSNFELTAAGLIGMLYAGCEYYFDNSDRIDRDEMISTLSNMIINGLCKK